MTAEVCPISNETCPWFNRPVRAQGAENGCFTDLDHRVPQRLATTTLASLYIYSPENKQQICRDEHDAKTREGDEPLPERQYMLSRVLAQVASGDLIVSRPTRRKLAKGKI
jgi:hypothetical protein